MLKISVVVGGGGGGDSRPGRGPNKYGIRIWKNYYYQFRNHVMTDISEGK